MSEYQVIARKFRPQTFDDVVGQHHVTRTLQNAIRAQRIPHAFLFTGTRGCGKTSTARILAKALNCTGGGATTAQPDPCNECENCTEITTGASLDVFEIDGASNNGVESIRELRENVRFMPNKGRFKVYIIDEAHMLSTAAWNALLKTLEEPPAHVIFVFATTEPQKILQTILSRVQRFDFKRIPTRAIANRLAEIAEAEGIAISPSGLAEVARAADGSLRDGQSLLDQLISFAGNEVSDDAVTEALGLIDRTLISDAAAALAARDARAALSVAHRVADAGHNAEAFAQAVLGRLRDLMVLKVVDDARDLVEHSEEETNELAKLATSFTREELDALFTMLSSSLEDLRADSPYLVLEMTLLRMTSLEPVAPLAELLERVEALAAGAPVAAGRKPSAGRGPGGGSGGGNTGGGGGGGGRPKLKRPSFMESEGAKRKQDSAPRQSRSTSNEAAPATTAPAAAAPAVAPVAFDWDGFVQHVRDRVFFGTYLANHCWLDAFDGACLKLFVRKGSVAESRLTAPEKIKELTGLLGKYLDRDPEALEVRVTVKDDGQSPQASAASNPRERRNKAAKRSATRRAEAKQLREEALSEPTIKEAMDELDAELTEVRPVRGGPKQG